MAATPVLSIDASSLNGIDFTKYIGEYFEDLTAGTNYFYGGQPDFVFGAQYYLNGSQILTRYTGEDGVTQSSKVALLDGDTLAYDFLHYGPAYGHGISGSVDSLTFGDWIDGQTTGVEGIGAAGRVTGLGAGLDIDGFDLFAAPGTGFDPATNTVYLLYSALRDMDADAIYGVISRYALDVKGSAGADVLVGYGGDDKIFGGAGADVLRGAAGKDLLQGGGGNDMLFGGAGADKLQGGAGNDKLFGGSGADVLVGGGGCDILTGGAGADIFVFAPGSAKDVICDFDLARDRIDLTAFDLGGADEIDVVDVAAGAKLYIDKVSVLLAGVEAADLNDGIFLL